MSKEKDYIKKIEGAERRYMATPVTAELRTDEGNEFATIEGYAALYNTRADLGWFEEEILPGAFDDVLNDDVRCLKNHDPNYVLARSVNGKGTLSLSVDSKGLKYSYTTPDITYARDLQKSIELGDVSQSSFGFIAEEVRWIERKDENELRQIVKVGRLFDVSPVTYPAYQDTSVAKRSFDAFKEETEENNDTAGARKDNCISEYEARYKFNLNKSKQ